MKTIAILPVKAFDARQERLAADSARTRPALAEAMATDVLRRAVRAPSASTRPRRHRASRRVAMDLADELGAEIVEEPERPRPQRRRARWASAGRVELGAERVLLAAGDCPLLTPAEVDALLGAPRRPGRGHPGRPPRHRHQRRCCSPPPDRDRARPSGRAAGSATPSSARPPRRAVDGRVTIPAFALRRRHRRRPRRRVRCLRSRDRAHRSAGCPRSRPATTSAPCSPRTSARRRRARARPQGGVQGRGPGGARSTTSRSPARPRARRRARQGPAPRPGHPRRDRARSSARGPAC